VSVNVIVCQRFLGDSVDEPARALSRGIASLHGNLALQALQLGNIAAPIAERHS
jgi:hypothetical protein